MWGRAWTKPVSYTHLRVHHVPFQPAGAHAADGSLLKGQLHACTAVDERAAARVKRDVHSRDIIDVYKRQGKARPPFLPAARLQHRKQARQLPLLGRGEGLQEPFVEQFLQMRFGVFQLFGLFGGVEQRCV